jgi:amino acid adenylation domain-containing protein
MTMAKDTFSRMSLEQRTALENRLLSRRTSATVPRRAGPKPLSLAQESLWIIDQLVPASALYNIPQAFRIRGPLDVAALEKSFAAVIRRHDALRTRLALDEQQQPRQIVSDQFQFRVSFEDFTDRETELRKRLDDEAKKPFRLTEDMLIRVLVLKMGPDDHVLCVNLHHIISDNGSLGILFQEVSAFYSAFSRNENVTLPEPSIHFTDLAAFQRETIPPGLAEAIPFWRERFDGTPVVLDFPTDRPPSSRTAFTGAWRPLTIPTPLTAELKQLSQRQNATLYMTLLAAFYVLLHRYSNAEVITVGSPIGQRDHPGCERMIGLLINTLPIRAVLDDQMTFAALLQRVRQEALDCYRQACTPFERILEELHLPRNGARHPLFQVVFQVIPASSAGLALLGTTVEEIPVQTGTAKFDLTFTLMESNGGLAGNMEFADDIFDAATIDRLIGHFEVLLEAIAANPDQEIGQLPLMTSLEREQVVVEWNETTTHYPRNETVHALFEEQARTTPNVTALALEDKVMTYGELNRLADQMAHRLQGLGVAAGTTVGVCLERSFELIASLIAVLKVGAVYVPLDPEYPASRLSYILDDASVSLLVTSRTLMSRIPGQVKTMSVDENVSAEGQFLRTTFNAESPAYIMYTSGSTGEPKGVAVPHRGIVRLVKNTNYATFAPDEVFLQFATVSFDASTFEIWGALLNGATLAIYPPHLDSLEQFAEVLRRHKVSTLWLTAGLFHQMVDHHLDALRGLRQLLAGGDVLSPTHVKKVLASLDGCQLINGYGPTENTTFTCCYSIPRDWDGNSVPIGRPISNTRVYILDRARNPVPVGIPGELCIAGDGLALGYWNSADLTAEKFINEAPFGRLYRTGDRARYLEDGNIEFLGRLDRQVKIRGFRVEPGEIEHALLRHPDIREAVVLVREDQELTAYFVAGSQDSSTSVREWLAGQLPAHMIPAHFVALLELPLNANGKVDRHRLPAPQNISTDALVGPRDERERAIAEIWKEVLGLKQIGIHQNFFELGGHSLFATRVISRLNQILGTAVPLRDLFENPTVALLAARTAQQKNEGAAPASIISRRARPRGQMTVV